MDHRKIYNALMKRAQEREPLAGYVEKHHIVPRCYGGSNDSSNIAVLTAREHFLAHRLLAKIHGGKMSYAFSMMSRFGKYDAWKYADVKTQVAKIRSKVRLGSRHSQATKDLIRSIRLGSKASEETVRKMRMKTASQETRLKMSESCKTKVAILQLKNGSLVSRYPSLAEAQRQTGVAYPSIIATAKGRRKTAGGFEWKYE